MAGYFETLAFGMGPIPLKDVKAGIEKLAKGQAVKVIVRP